MKKFLLILLMLLLPCQAANAAQRNIAHLLGGYASDTSFTSRHIAEHVAYLLHHHDDDGNAAETPGIHVDDENKSVQHLSDYEHGGSLNLLLQPLSTLLTTTSPDMVPTFVGISYLNCTTLPPLRPPCLPA